MQKSDSDRLSVDLYRVVRTEIEHEDQLINHRLSWLVSSQSFLLTAFAISLNAPTAMRSPDYERLNQIMYAVLPCAALASIVLIYPTILAAMIAMARLRRHLRGRQPPGFPPVQISNLTLVLGHIGPALVPWVFIITWVRVVLGSK